MKIIYLYENRTPTIEIRLIIQYKFTEMIFKLPNNFFFFFLNKEKPKWCIQILVSIRFFIYCFRLSLRDGFFLCLENPSTSENHKRRCTVDAFLFKVLLLKVGLQKVWVLRTWKQKFQYYFFLVKMNGEKKIAIGRKKALKELINLNFQLNDVHSPLESILNNRSTID